MFCPKCGNQNEDTNRFCKKCGRPLPHQAPFRQPASTGLVGHVLDGKYRIDAKLGSGGMGEVYQATRLLIGDVVAIKVLHPHLAVDPQAAERFRREAVTATKLRHRNVVTIFDVGIAADYKLPYILMELAEGFSLRQIINEHKVLPLDFAVTVTAQVCAALDEAHRLGIIHRDIKPENIIANQTDRGWQIKILDFGIAKLHDQADIGLTQDGNAMGTPQYMSPEQCMGEPLDARSDIYSVGILLYELLCGTVPFKAASPAAIAVAQVQNAPALPHKLNPDIYPQVEEVILRSLAKQPIERQRTASHLAQELIQAATAAFRAGYAQVSSTPIPTPTVTPDFVPIDVSPDDVTEAVIESPIAPAGSEVTEVLPTVVLQDAVAAPGWADAATEPDITITTPIDDATEVLQQPELPPSGDDVDDLSDRQTEPDLGDSSLVLDRNGDEVPDAHAPEPSSHSVVTEVIENEPMPPSSEARDLIAEAPAIPVPTTALPLEQQVELPPDLKKTQVGRKRKLAKPPVRPDIPEDVPLVAALGQKRLDELLGETAPIEGHPVEISIPAGAETVFANEDPPIPADLPPAVVADAEMPTALFSEQKTAVLEASDVAADDMSFREDRAETPNVIPDRPVETAGAEEPPKIFSEPAAAPTDKRMLLIVGGIIALGLFALVTAGSMYFLWGPSSGPGAEDKPSITEGTPSAPDGMAHVPGGEFTMGSGQGDKFSRPEHKVTVGPFFMDVTEVTNEDYKEFVTATGHKTPPDWKNGTFPDGKARFPVTGVDWNDAEAFAKWKGKRLPTEEEWEFAARGSDGRAYPWGSDWKPGYANAGGGSTGIQEVKKAQGTSPFGLYDMSGNAWEWTASDANAYSGGTEFVNIKIPSKVIRGGSWQSNKKEVMAWNRAAWGISGEPVGYANTSFRCVKDPSK